MCSLFKIELVVEVEVEIEIEIAKANYQLLVINYKLEYVQY